MDRTGFLGGSDAAAIFGVSPWATPLDCYLEKTGQGTRETDPAKERIFRRGKRLEPVAVDMLIEEYGIDVVKRSSEAEPNRYTHPQADYLRAEIDFEWRVSQEIADVYDLDPALVGTVQNGEIKTVHPFAAKKFGEAETDEVPIEYTAQAMHGLMVTNREVTLFGVLVGADRLALYFVKRDNALVQAMWEREVAFWQGNVLAMIPPPPSNLDDIKRLFTKTNGRPVEITAEILEQMRELQRVRQQVKALEAREEELQFGIQNYVCAQWGVQPGDSIKDDAVLKLNGADVATWKRQSGAYLDQKQLKADMPELVTEYTRRHEYRVLRIAKGA